MTLVVDSRAVDEGAKRDGRAMILPLAEEIREAKAQGRSIWSLSSL